MLIVEDERDEAAALLPDDIRTRYYFVSGINSIGMKRNLANRLAYGEIIVHWDDDDWSYPGRIEEQVQALQQPRIAVTGYREMYFEHVETGEAYKYVGPQRYGLGTSLAYWKKHWEANRFQDRMVGEDNDFVTRSRAVLHSIPAEHRMLARIHSGTTSEKLKGSNWFKVDRKELPCVD